MARSRNIKPGFFKNEDLAEISPVGRLFFAGLWLIADREGRLQDRPRRLWAELMPYDPYEGEEVIQKLEEFGFILRYEADGGRYIQIVNFAKHQAPHYKEVASTIPAPPGWSDSGTTPGGVPDEVRTKILERDGKCLECGATDNLTLDHIVPRSLGGSHEEENLQTLCRRCNSSKNNRTASGQRQSDVGSTSADGPEGTSPPLIPGFLDSLIPSNTPHTPQGGNKPSSPVGVKAFLDNCKAAGELPIPEDDPVFDYAQQTKIPREFLNLCFREFVERNIDSGKRYKDWRKAFRNCVRSNWYKLWYADQASGQMVLTTTGVQAQRKHREAA